MVLRVQVDISAGVAVVRLADPPHNVLGPPMRTALVEIAATLADRAEVRAVVLAGNDQVFAVGADAPVDDGSGTDGNSGRARSLQGMCSELAELQIPVVAAVEGDALGDGLELALCADHRVAGDRARFSLHELLAGWVPGGDGSKRLNVLVGLARAGELRETGRLIDAYEAATIGLVNRVVPAGSAVKVAAEFADELAAGPYSAIKAIRQAVDHRLGGPSTAGAVLDWALNAGHVDGPVGEVRVHGPGERGGRPD